MTSRNAEVSDADRAGQAVAVESEPETPGPQLAVGDHANVADVIEQHQGVPSGEDDYER